MPGILLATAYTCLFLLLMRRMRFFNGIPGLPWHHLSYLFILKILAGMVLWAIYTYVYPDRQAADIFKFYDDGLVMFSALPERPVDYLQMVFGIRNDTPYFSEEYYMRMNNWFRQYESNVYNDAHTVIRYNAAVRLFSFGEYHVHTVVSAFLALTGMTGIYRIFVHRLPGRERALMISIFLLPSVLLWTSGVIKESLLFFGLGIMLHQVFRLMDGRISMIGILVLAASLVLNFYLKFYVLMSLLPALLLYAITRRRKPWSIPIWALLVYAGGILLALNIHMIRPGFDVLGLLALKQRDFIGLAQGTHAGSFVMPPRLDPDLLSFIMHAPYALYITLLGPMIHFQGALGSISAMENVLVVSAMVIMLLYSRPWAQVDRPLVISLFAYILLLALVIGWTTPVIGAIVRYRTPLLPFLLIMALLLFDHTRAISRWPVLKHIISA